MSTSKFKKIVSEIQNQLCRILPLWLGQTLTNWLPENRVTIRLRGALIRPFIGKCGKNLQLAKNITFLNPHGIEIGNDVYIATSCWIDGIGGLTIDDEVELSPYVVITTSSHCFKDNSVRFGGSRIGAVHIGKGSWLASHVVVAANCSIGSGTIVGSNAVVTKDIPDNVFAAGIPAKVVGPRIGKKANIYSRFEQLNS
ncbi:MAG: acyltransferase [Planctomycetota bacterium]|jgi:maltose O-acetyltransferase